MAYTVLAGKGKVSCFLFGIVNTPLYAYIAFKSGYYGDFALNAYYFAWYRAWSAGNGSVSILLMWLLFLVNGIYLLSLWIRIDRKKRSTPLVATRISPLLRSSICPFPTLFVSRFTRPLHHKKSFRLFATLTKE